MTRLGAETFDILRAPLLIDPVDGSQYRDWLNPVHIPVVDANVQPFMMAEKLNLEEDRDREFSQTALRFYCPPGTRVEATDKILYNGVTYEVFGHGGVWHRFSGAEHHVQFIGRRKEG